jgi:hypothetical protein
LFLSIPCFKNLSIMAFLFKGERETILVMCASHSFISPLPQPCVQTSLILVLPSLWTEIIVWLH